MPTVGRSPDTSRPRLRRAGPPAQLGAARTERGARARQLLEGLWAGRTPAGVTALPGAPGRPPASLQAALRDGPDAVARLLCDEPDPDMSTGTRNWGSGGSHLWAPDEEVQGFLRGIFQHVADAGLGIGIGTQDLYHGHMFGIPPGEGGDGELGILFHAKEHPQDIPDGKGVGSGYTTASPEYANRNLLYLASTNRVYVIDPRGENRCLLANLENEAFIPPAFHPDRVKAVDESGFSELGVQLPDVNLLPTDLSAPDGDTSLFLKAYREPPPEPLPAPDTDAYERRALAKELGKILGTRTGSDCAAEARRGPRLPPSDPGTGAGGFGGSCNLVSVRLL